MALGYSIDWRKKRGGIEGCVDLHRENFTRGGIEEDVLYYVRDKSLWRNILTYEGGKITCRDVPMPFHPYVAPGVLSGAAFIFNGTLQLGLSFLSEKDVSLLVPVLSSALTSGVLFLYFLSQLSEGSVKAWNLYQERNKSIE